eukprot:m.115912 g.115912  ORF g.115912 m.115912 type:complete len:194 (-) comp17159_c0_seq1:213-794(-)
MILQASVQPYVCTTTLLPLVLVIVLVIETNGGEQNACVERQHENSLVKKASWIKFAEEKNGLSKMLQATTAWGSHERDIADLQSDHPLLVCVGYGRTGIATYVLNSAIPVHIKQEFGNCELYCTTTLFALLFQELQALSMHCVSSGSLQNTTPQRHFHWFTSLSSIVCAPQRQNPMAYTAATFGLHGYTHWKG